MSRLAIIGMSSLLALACGGEGNDDWQEVGSSSEAASLSSAAGEESTPADAVAGDRGSSRGPAAGDALVAARSAVAADFAGESEAADERTIAGRDASLRAEPVAAELAPAELVEVPFDKAAFEATVELNSARRSPKRDWQAYAGRQRAAVSMLVPTAVDAAVAPWLASTSNVPVWNHNDIWALFRAVRDNRNMSDSSSFRRRPTWMYPDDGCWIRAELAAIGSVEAGKPKPAKLFSFGNLNVSTPNHPSGSVSWWYHVVPAVKSASNGVIYVIDPAIDPTQPLDWVAWLYKQVTNLNNITVTFADGGAYGPFDPVTGNTPPPKATVISNMQGYMPSEWSRQTSMGRDPVIELGYFPPWASDGKDFNADGKSDIVWRHPVNGTTQPWYMNGTTRLGWNNLPYTVQESTGWRYAGSGDFNRDGKTDIIWYHGGSGITQVWYMDGLTRTGWGNLVNTVPESSGWTFGGADDFNYDGKTDIIWRNGTTGYTQIWYLNDQLGLVSWPNLQYQVTDASGWKLAATGDFNRDGKTDVIWRHGSSGIHQFWYLDEVTLTSWANMSYTVSDASGWRFFSAREFSYDGRTDIIWQHGSSGTLQLWRMDGLTRLSYSNLPYTVSDASGWYGGGY